MNEIKKIHLGRQPFTISVDAYKVLQVYLEAIKHQVGGKSEVIKEIESRMAELLIERGVIGEKVVLPEDVEFLKEQLGDPGDFKDDDHEAIEPAEQLEGQKRLYRDPQNAMIAGVCSGIAAYFGVDATIVRLIFIIALFFGGAAIPVYLVLWLVMPEAKTPSERLQMQGKAVTVDSLKELVDRADVKGAADRATKTVGPLFEKIVKVCSAIMGSTIILVAAALFAALTTAGSYLFFHHHKLIAQTIPFPVGKTESVFVAMCAVVGGIISLLTLLIGVAMVRRKWLVPGWITAALIGIMLIAGAVGVAVGPDAVYGVRDRYNAAQHTSIKQVDAFNSVNIKGRDVNVIYEQSDNYQVGVRYLGKGNPNDLKYTVKDGVLTIDASRIDGNSCDGVCFATGGFEEVLIRAPKLEKVVPDGQPPFMRIPPFQHFNTDGYYN